MTRIETHWSFFGKKNIPVSLTNTNSTTQVHCIFDDGLFWRRVLKEDDGQRII